MPYRPLLIPGHLYHIYNRGVEYRPIFTREQHWIFWTNRFVAYLEGKGRLLAYCLMPNHFHLLVEIGCTDFGNQVMKPFGSSYVNAFNRQEGRVGPLYQNRFQAKWVDTDDYLLTLSRYIHMNPVWAGLVRHPSAWPHSSYQDFVRGETRPWLHTEPVFEALQTKGYWPRGGLTREDAYARYVMRPRYGPEQWEDWWVEDS